MEELAQPDLMDSIEKMLPSLPGMLTSFGSLGWPGWLAGGILLAVLGTGFVLLIRWRQNRALVRRQKENEKQRLKDEAALAEEQARLEEGVQESARRIREKMSRKEGVNLTVQKTSVECPAHGVFRTGNKMPRGVVIHYTGGRAVNSLKDAERHLADMAKRGLGALLVGNDGTIYAPKNWTGSEVFFHAGDSEWKGEKSLNGLCVGLEVACAGRLEAGVYTWWGQEVPAEQRRTVRLRGNMAPGTYQKFTPAQTRAIVDFIRVQQVSNPDFDLDFVVGHDEIAPLRKTDPGGSLSVTMPKFRKALEKTISRA